MTITTYHLYILTHQSLFKTTESGELDGLFATVSKNEINELPKKNYYSYQKKTIVVRTKNAKSVRVIHMSTDG